MIVLLLAFVVFSLTFWSYWWQRSVLPQIAGEMEVDSTSIKNGGCLHATFTVRNNSRLPAPFVLCRMTLPSGLCLRDPAQGGAESEHERALAVSVSLRPLEAVSATFTLYGTRRGIQHLREFQLELSDGWTPRRVHQSISIYRLISVHPKDVSHTGEPEQNSTPLGQRVRNRKRFATSQDWIDLRPYRAGDSPRDMAWNVSARRGELIVLERADSESPDAIVVVNVQTNPDFLFGTNTKASEACLEDGFHLTQSLLREEASVIVYTNAVQHGRSRAVNAPLLNQKGPLTPSAAHRTGDAFGRLLEQTAFSFARLLRLVRQQTLTPTRIVVVTTYDDAESRAALSELERAGHHVSVHWLRRQDAQGADTRDNGQRNLSEGGRLI